MEKKQQEAMQQQQMNGQIQQQSAQVAEQAKQQTLQMEYTMKSELEKVKAEMEARLIELRGQFDLERERIAASGRVESSYVQAVERQDSNVRDNKAKLIKEDKQDGVPQIDIKANLESRVAPETTGGKELTPSVQPFDFSEPSMPEQNPMAKEEPQMGTEEAMGGQMPQEGMMPEGMPQEEAMGMPQEEMEEVNPQQEQDAQILQMLGAQ